MNLRSNRSLAASPDRPKVVIIGGGIAGLSAAISLSDSDRERTGGNGACSRLFDIVLLESRRQTGGRAGSFQDPVSGAVLDYCQHVAMGCCTNLIGMLDEVHLLDRFTRYESLDFYHPDAGFSRFRPSGFLPPPLHLNSALSGLKHLTIGEKTRIRHGLWSLMRTDEQSLCGVLAVDWLARSGQTKAVRDRFWDVILVSALGDVPENVSMSAARKVIVDGFAASRGASDVWVPNRSLSEIFGESFASKLRHRGVDVRTSHAVRELRQITTADHSTKIEVVTSENSALIADHVVIAASWRAASRLIRSISLTEKTSATNRWRTETLAALGAIKSSPITGLHLWFDRPLTELAHVAMVGTITHWMFRQPIVNVASDPVAASNQAASSNQVTSSNDNHIAACDDGIYHQVVISGRHPLSDSPKELLTETVCGELRRAFPRAAGAKLLRSRIVTDPSAVYSVSPQFESHRVASQTPLPWLSLAGDYVATGWPATMEGATISGRLVAQQILQRFNGTSAIPVQNIVDGGLVRGKLSRLFIR